MQFSAHNIGKRTLSRFETGDVCENKEIIKILERSF